MERTEFIETLKNQLSGQMAEARIDAHVRYYQDYIQSRVRSGSTEQEVLEQLGDPRMIAKTLIDTEPGSADDVYEENYAGDYENYMDRGSEKPEPRWKKYVDLSTWYGKALVIAAAAVIIVCLFAVVSTVLPFFIILIAVLSFLSWLKNRK